MKTDVFAFVDESGDTNVAVEKPGVTSYFIITATLVSKDLDHHRKEAERIRERFFQTGEMKSSTIGSRDERRLAILAELAQTDLRTYTLAVDKRELQRDGGLAYKASFFKRLNRMLYDNVCRAHDSVAFVADQHGSREFMDGFKSYVSRKARPTLYTDRTFSFVDSRDEVLVQVSDVVSGSWARVWEPTRRSARAAEISKLLASMSLGVVIWPPRTIPAPQGVPMDNADGHDELVRWHCYRQAVEFLEERHTEDGEHELASAQTVMLLFLLFRVQFVDAMAFVSTDKILEHLAGPSWYSDEQVSTPNNGHRAFAGCWRHRCEWT